MSSPQARAERTCRLSFRNETFDDGIGVAGLDVKRNLQAREVVRKDMRGEARLFLIKIDSYDPKLNRGTSLQNEQDVEQPITVFPARQTDHDFVAVRDESVVGYGLSDQAAKACLQFLRLLLKSGRRSILMHRHSHMAGSYLFAGRPVDEGSMTEKCRLLRTIATLFGL